MNTLLTRWVWIERGMVLIANVAVNLGIATTTQESKVAAGGIIGVVVFIQIVAAVISHVSTLKNTLRADITAILSKLLDEPLSQITVTSSPPATITGYSGNVSELSSPPVTSGAEAAAKAAGKAVTNGN